MAAPPPTGGWLGMVVPKRHAKRSVTRNLVKRQIRAVFDDVGLAGERAAGLRPGLWVVRLRAPIDRSRFPSAASDALRRAMRDELAAEPCRRACTASGPRCGACRAARWCCCCAATGCC
ncbi:ribonuclease P protein component [Piscinibacter sakaiensis]|uniref:ribonuclease P protein component n=1 Tax=Piscinibacter sakaiensis TaxID=1547922 RepID=UPI0037288D93